MMNTEKLNKLLTMVVNERPLITKKLKEEGLMPKISALLWRKDIYIALSQVTLFFIMRKY